MARITREIKNRRNILISRLERAGVIYNSSTSLEDYKVELKEAVRAGRLTALEMIDLLEEIKSLKSYFKETHTKIEGKGKRSNRCIDCRAEIEPYSKRCMACYRKHQQAKKEERSEVKYVKVKYFIPKDLLDSKKVVQGGVPGAGKLPGSRTRRFS